MIITEVAKKAEFERNSLLDEMRKSRENANTAFITFTENYREFTDFVFCFYEGEDGKYYNNRIKEILGDAIIPIKAGNKSNVLNVWRRINNNRVYDHVSKMFFVDRDMDEIPEDMDKDLYITPCYSIENLYVNKKAFSSILESEFLLNKVDCDYKKCIDLFNNLYEQFCNEMVEFNALVFIRNRKKLGNGNVSLNDIKITKMFSINFEGITRKETYITVINSLKEKLAVKDAELYDAINQIHEKKDYGNRFRGKNQLDFFVELIRLLKEANKNNFFFNNIHTSVNITLTNNRLSELSQYAITPDCLKKFIQSHKLAI